MLMDLSFQMCPEQAHLVLAQDTFGSLDPWGLRFGKVKNQCFSWDVYSKENKNVDLMVFFAYGYSFSVKGLLSVFEKMNLMKQNEQQNAKI